MQKFIFRATFVAVIALRPHAILLSCITGVHQLRNFQITHRCHMSDSAEVYGVSRTSQTVDADMKRPSITDSCTHLCSLLAGRLLIFILAIYFFRLISLFYLLPYSLPFNRPIFSGDTPGLAGSQVFLLGIVGASFSTGRKPFLIFDQRGGKVLKGSL